MRYYVELWNAKYLFDLYNFFIIILFQGFYRGGKFSFSFKVGPGYPHEPPKVKCETQVYHPNIDLEGNVCLNILREDWKPVLTINSIIYGLQYLFLVSSFFSVHWNPSCPKFPRCMLIMSLFLCDIKGTQSRRSIE
jgi:ubiquitin-protein ligase